MPDKLSALFLRVREPLAALLPDTPCTYWEHGRAFVAVNVTRRPTAYEHDPAHLQERSLAAGECIHLACLDAAEPILFYAHAVEGRVVRAFRAYAGVVRPGDGTGTPERWEAGLRYAVEDSLRAVADALDLPRSALELVTAPEGSVVRRAFPRATSRAPAAVVQRFSEDAQLQVRMAARGHHLVFQDARRTLMHGWHLDPDALVQQAQVLFHVPPEAWSTPEE